MIVFDRDGVLIFESRSKSKYVLDSRDVVLNKFLLKKIAEFQKIGGKCAVATNQQCVGLGLLTEQKLSEINDVINEFLFQAGGVKMEFFICKHVAKENCNCRKPKPGLILDVSTKFGIKTRSILFIGDQLSDEIAAKNAGCNFMYLDVLTSKLENLSLIHI